MSALSLVKDKQEIRRQIKAKIDEFWLNIELHKVEHAQSNLCELMILNGDLRTHITELEKMGIAED